MRLAALRGNLRRLLDAAGPQKVLAVVKADAYGHGLVPCARALCGPEPAADGLAVARLAEALSLRKAGISQRIVVLGGCAQANDLPLFNENRIDLVVHGPEQIAWIEEASQRVRVAVWLKIDSGMHRLGFPLAEAQSAWQRLRACRAVLGRPPLMTHVANADDRMDHYTREQIRRFNGAVEGLGAERSIANSAALLGWPESRADWARPGLALYGISPFLDGVGPDLGLEPVMALETRLLAVKEIAAGAPVGYGGAWRSPEPMRLGVAAIGYADGYPRHAPAGTPVLVDGARAAVVGRVSMDLLTVDLRTVPQARVGSPVTLWGTGLPVEEVARAIGCIPYELVAGLGQRVERRWC